MRPGEYRVLRSRLQAHCALIAAIATINLLCSFRFTESRCFKKLRRETLSVYVDRIEQTVTTRILAGKASSADRNLVGVTRGSKQNASVVVVSVHTPQCVVRTRDRSRP